MNWIRICFRTMAIDDIQAFIICILLVLWQLIMPSFNIKYSFRRMKNWNLWRRLNVLLLSSWCYILALSIFLLLNKNRCKASTLLSRSKVMSQQFIKKFITDFNFGLLVLKIRFISSFFFNLFDEVFTLLWLKSIYNLPEKFSWR